MPKEPDPSLPIRAVVAAARIRVARAVATIRAADKWRLPDRVRRELAHLEPVLARALTDAQILLFLKAAQETASKAGLLASADDSDEARESELRGETRPPDEPPALYFPDVPDAPDPLVRFPAIEAAAADLASRADFTTQDFEALATGARTNAFTVARAVTLDAVQRVRLAVAEDIEHGGTLAEFRERTALAIAESSLADHQVEAIYRTQVARAVASGQRAILESPMVVDAFPYLMWSATHDGRVRPDHLAMEKAGLDGTAVFRVDDPIWNTYYPPCGWNCFLPETIIQGRVLLATRFKYRGKAIEIRTRNGQRLRVTANHPILTPGGFRTAQAIKEGDHVFSYRSGIETGLSANGGGEGVVGVTRSHKTTIAPPGEYKQHDPAGAEQLFRSLADRGGILQFPMGADDFHGDAVGGDGQIEVVAANRELFLDIDPTGPQLKSDFGFSVMDGGFSRVSRLCPTFAHFESISAPATSLPGCLALGSDSIATGFSQRGPFQPLCVGPASQILASRFHASGENGSGNTRPFTDTQERFAAFIRSDQNGKIGNFRSESALHRAAFQGVGSGARSERYVSATKVAFETDFTDAKFATELRERFASVITLDQAIEIRNFEWSGHVYDFQTEGGWLIADSVVVSNCRCMVFPLTVRDAAGYGCREAKTWAETGDPPTNPQHVAKVPIVLPKGWVPTTARVAAAV